MVRPPPWSSIFQISRISETVSPGIGETADPMIEPRLIILQPTPYCNINCSYCYLGHRDDRRLMSRNIVEALREKLFRRLSPQSAPIVVWHAGEPTAAPI